MGRSPKRLNNDAEQALNRRYVSDAWCEDATGRFFDESSESAHLHLGLALPWCGFECAGIIHHYFFA
jgi:hypothetical protein